MFFDIPLTLRGMDFLLVLVSYVFTGCFYRGVIKLCCVFDRAMSMSMLLPGESQRGDYSECNVVYLLYIYTDSV